MSRPISKVFDRYWYRLNCHLVRHRQRSLVSYNSPYHWFSVDFVTIFIEFFFGYIIKTNSWAAVIDRWDMAVGCQVPLLTMTRLDGGCNIFECTPLPDVVVHYGTNTVASVNHIKPVSLLLPFFTTVNDAHQIPAVAYCS